MNDATMGFMLEATPVNGANETIALSLDHLLRTKLPRGIPLCVHLMSSQLVGERIEYGLRKFSGPVSRRSGSTPSPAPTT